ncbi:MAG: carboxylating nicotinate-nucleotide diphosphorylase [Elusimicrobia bacterium]|nr:carboxylating nicotinate-nucleotide diphosphorylase [Elusimicrobiota bacterium]
MPGRANPALKALIRAALAEDLGAQGDLSTKWFTPTAARLKGRIVVKAPGVVCGLDVAREVFRAVSSKIRFQSRAKDGDRVRPGQSLADVTGPREVLTAERTALNFLQRMSGVATLARAFADQVKGTSAKVYDTRKTLPGWRALDKYAVRCGGGRNHRLGLYDMVMLKDNHLEVARQSEDRLERFRKAHPGVPILIEAKTRGQVEMALSCGADIVLLDNMASAELRRMIALIRSRAPMTRIEVSGGVSLENVRSIARLGVDRISVGRLTHSAPALDMSLEIGS